MAAAAVSAPERWWPWALMASVVGPLVLYIWTASPGPYWLDSSEFVAAVWTAGVPHPPGHPLYVAATQPAALVGLGSAATRVNLASAVYTAAACGVLAWLARRWLLRLGVSPASSALLGALAAWMAGGSYALWFQAIRAEVYGLHLLVASALVALASEMELRAVEGGVLDRRLLYGLGFAAGLGLSNHHYLTVFVLAPIGLWMLARGAWRRVLLGWDGLRAVGFGLAGLAVYVWLPAAASRDPFVNWGRPDTWENFIWVVSAQAFQKTLDRATEVDGWVLAADLYGQLARQLTPVGFVVALAGFAGVIRARDRGLAALWGGVLVCNLITQSLFNFDPFNPDVHGYFELSVWLLGLGVACAVGVVHEAAARLAAVGGAQGRVARGLGFVVTGSVCLACALNVALGFGETSRAGFRDVDRINATLLASMPPGSVVLTSNYKTLFNLWYAQGVAGARPDVAVVHRNFFPNAPYIDELRRRHPELLVLAEGGGGSTRVDQAALLELARQRPVFVEVDVNLQDELLPWLEPEGLLFRVVPEGVPPGLLPEAVGRRQIRCWLELERDLWARAQGGALDLETQRALIWAHYLTTLALARQGHDVLAQFHLDRASAINPSAPELIELQRQLIELDRSNPARRDAAP